MSQKLPKPGYIFSTKYTNYIFMLLFLLYMFDYIDRMVVTSLFVFLERDWNITSTQSGMLVSAVYWSIVVLTFPISIFVDRWSRKKTIGTMAVIWSLATALCALTGNFTQLLFARILVGVGEAGYSPGGTAMIAGLYPQEKRAQMLGLWNASIPLGAAIGVGLGGIIAATWGWRHAFGLVALPGLIIAILFFFIKDYKTVGINLPKTDKKTDRASIKVIAHEFIEKPSFLFTSFGMAAVIFVTTALMTWLPKYFLVVNSLNEKQAGFRASLVFLLAIIGAPLGGYLTDRWRKHKMRARLLFPTITTVIAAILLYLALHIHHSAMQYVVFLAFGTTVTAFASAAAAVTQDVVHAGLRAVSYSIAVVVQNLLGASFAPVIIGFLIDKQGIEKALVVLPFVLLAGALLFYLGSRHYEKDFSKVKIVQLEAE